VDTTSSLRGAKGVVAWLGKSVLCHSRGCYISSDYIKYKELILYGMEYVRERIRNENKVA
jgi:hypothetical protein